MEGADPARTALLCLFHDTQETRVGDIPSVGRAYLTSAPNEQVTSEQVAALPAEAVRELVGEYEARTSLEAQVARDADKLECLIQAREYQVQGYANVTPWVETSAAALRTVSAKRLAEACQQVAPGEWWRAFRSLRADASAKREPGARGKQRVVRREPKRHQADLYASRRVERVRQDISRGQSNE
jgi:putative hydrolase of HD superfamily